MEGVGARLGRSSSRYGTTTTVFNGPVRKWKKDWVFISPSSSSSSSSNNGSISNHHRHLHSSSFLSNGSINGHNNGTVSHLRLFKWTPVNGHNKENLNSNNNNIPSGNDSAKNDAVSEEPPRKKFKYIPIAVLEEQKTEEGEEKSDDEAKSDDADENTAEQASKGDGHDEKPDINDFPMEDNQTTEEHQTTPARQDLNVSTLDLSLA